MITSPIKTVLKNVSGKRLTFQISFEKRITLLPSGSGLDTATINGDVFSQFSESRGSEPLLHSVINGEVLISYKIEPQFAVTRCDNILQAATNNMGGLYRKWAESKHQDTLSVSIKENEAKDIEPANVKKAEEVIAASVVDIATEPVVTEEPPAVEPVKSVDKAVETVDVVTEPIVNKAEESTVSVEEEQPKKKSRRVKLG